MGLNGVIVFFQSLPPLNSRYVAAHIKVPERLPPSVNINKLVALTNLTCVGMPECRLRDHTSLVIRNTLAPC